MLTELKEGRRSTRSWVLGGVLALLAATAGVWVISGIHFVDQYEVGIQVEDGEITGQLDSGWHIVLGVNDDVKTVVVAPVEGQVTGLSVATRDNFAMNETTVSFSREIPATYAKELVKKTPFYKKMFKTAVAQATKNTVGDYELMVVPENRNEIEAEIRAAANTRLSEQLPADDPLQNVVLSSYKWEESARTYLAEIRAKQEKIRTAKLEAEEAAVRRDEQLADAEAEAKRAELQADAEAATTLKEAEAAAEAEKVRHEERMRQQRAEQKAELQHQRQKDKAKIAYLEALVRQVGPDGAVMFQRWEKWDGQLPQVGGRLKMERELGSLK
jgi:regulator of protease activity HflC (stomatin/prohibitin superfamily)